MKTRIKLWNYSKGGSMVNDEEVIEKPYYPSEDEIYKMLAGHSKKHNCSIVFFDVHGVYNKKED